MAVRARRAAMSHQMRDPADREQCFLLASALDEAASTLEQGIVSDRAKSKALHWCVGSIKCDRTAG
jgi:hypothetical protein